ncbi:hypothetical protein ACWGHM_37170 [Streptomyces sp. NPDC054904]
MVIEIALAVRVFGPDAVRCGRRLLTGGIRIGVTDMHGAARRASAEPQDGRLEVEQ